MNGGAFSNNPRLDQIWNPCRLPCPEDAYPFIFFTSHQGWLLTVPRL